MAAVRAVAVLAAGAAGAEGVVVRDVLLAAVRAGAGVRAAHPAAAAHDAAPVAAARALVAVRPAAETGERSSSYIPSIGYMDAISRRAIERT